MLWAILSDVHGRGDRLTRVIADAQAAGATRFLSLGDVGGTAPIDLLTDVDAECVFGNWEASGLRGMAQPYRGIVSRWPALHRADGVWAGHASPVWPAGLTIAGVVDYLRQRDLHWLELFPSLCHSEAARWAALAELEAAAAPIFFHGHTHIQEGWLWRGAAAPQHLAGPTFTLESENDRCLIGVGSVGMPHDGRNACYVLYDAATRRVEWRRM